MRSFVPLWNHSFRRGVWAPFRRGVWAPLCSVGSVAASLEQQLGLECSGSVGGKKRPEKLKLSHVASTDIWEKLSYEIWDKATAVSPVFSFQQTHRMFIWVLGLLKSSVEVGNSALSQQEGVKIFFFCSWEWFLALYILSKLFCSLVLLRYYFNLVLELVYKWVLKCRSVILMNKLDDSC